jgi:hypothetical protein
MQFYPNQGTRKSLPPTPKPFAPEDETALREALKRCSPVDLRGGGAISQDR